MATLTQSILTEALNLLQDPDGTRWPSAELLRHLNDGQREIATQRPDMFAVTASVALTGVRHTLPDACVDLIEIPRNTNGAPIRMVDRSMLDAVEPTWMTKTASKVIKHACYDSKEQRVFYSYPPAATGASVEIVYSKLPADAVANSAINCPDVFKNALLNFVLFRAYAKDAEGTSNAALSASYYQLFKAGVVEEASPRQAVQPTPTN